MADLPTKRSQLFCWVFMIVGMAIVVFGICLGIKSLRTAHWPVADGIIRSAEMKTSSGEHGTSYSPAVTYDYLVAGASFTGNKIAVGQMSSSAEYARGVLKQYPVGQKVSVHYSPGDPADAVLEPGIHGGTWICLAVGTAFTLVAILFLQIQRSVLRAQIPGSPESKHITIQRDGSVGMDQPPVMMGVIFLLAGVGLAFIHPESGQPGWLMYAVGGFFSCAGLMLLLYRLKDKSYFQIMLWVCVVMFLVIFHWVSFGAGERTGTASGPFSVTHLVNVRTPFAIFTILVDVIIGVTLAYRLWNWWRNR